MNPGANDSIEAAAGETIFFPVDGWNLVNQGTADATAENRDLRHGFYLTADDTVEFDVERRSDQRHPC